MKTPDPEGAEAAATYFVDLYHYVLQTGDTEAWDAASDSACEFCVATREEAVDISTHGGRYVPRAPTVGAPRHLAFDETLRIFAVEVPYESAGADVFGPDGTVVETRTGFDGYLVLDVGYQPGSGWKLVGLMTSEERLG